MDGGKSENDGSTEVNSVSERCSGGTVVYSVPISVLIGLQCLIPAALNFFHWPLKIFSVICLLPDDHLRGILIAQMFFVAGITTIIQGLLGARYPLIIGPSAVFMSSLAWNFKTVYWEYNTDGDLYAMGPELRYNEYLVRTNEIRAVIMTTYFAASLVFSICWYLRIYLPSLMISATIISSSLHNICLLLSNVTEVENSSLINMTLGLLFVLYLFERSRVTSLKVMTNGDKKIELRTLKVFGVLFAFIMVLSVCLNLNIGQENLLKRAFAYHPSLSFIVITEVTIMPEVTFRGLLFLPHVLSQVLLSYCCYAFLCNNLDRRMKAVLYESIFNIVSPMIGVFLPMTVDPSSLGLSYMTDIRNSGTSVISGALLIVLSWCMGIVDFSAFVPFGFLCGINLYLHAILIYKGLDRSIKDLKFVCVLVLTSMTISLLTPAIDGKSYTNLIIVFIKEPIVLTFVFSLLLTQANKLFSDKR